MRYLLLGISGFISVVSALLAWYQPQKRWLALRSAALLLESEIWKFRASFGIVVKGDSRTREDDFRDFVNKVIEQAVTGSSSGATDLYSMFAFGEPNEQQLSICKHGQFSPKQQLSISPNGKHLSMRGGSDWRRCCRRQLQSGRTDAGTVADKKETKVDNLVAKWDADDHHSSRDADDHHSSRDADDHHSPLDPDEYIKHRVKRHVDFYQGRLPYYYYRFLITELLIVSGGATGTFLAAFGLPTWTAICTAATTFAISWSAYHQTQSKLIRYSNTVERVGKIIPWWQHLSSIEKSNADNIQRLVDECESIFHEEWEAWCTTSMKLHKMSGATEDLIAVQKKHQ